MVACGLEKEGSGTAYSWTRAACALCNQLDETTNHLRVHSRDLVAVAGIVESPSRSPPARTTRCSSGGCRLTWASFPRPLQRSFDALVLLVSWCAWKERNRRTFNRQAFGGEHLDRRWLWAFGAAHGFGNLLAPAPAVRHRRKISFLVSTTVLIRHAWRFV